MDNVEQKIIEHEQQIKTLFNNQARIEKVVDKIDKLTLSIEKMTVIQQDMIEEQKAIKEDVTKIKEQPAKDAHEIKMKVTF
jgi:predicted  nucleic acid-binding Zn ribbon protein